MKKNNNLKICLAVVIQIVLSLHSFGQVSIPPPGLNPAWAGNPAGNQWSGTFVGVEAGKNTTANYNSAFGYQSGISNTGGQGNNFFGYQSGFNNTNGSSNIFIGYQSGFANTTGIQNIFMGNLSGLSFSSGNSNTMIGIESGRGFSSGNGNCFLGYKVGYNDQTNTSVGDENTFIGVTSGRGHLSGNRNAYLGFAAGYFNTTGERNTSVGANSGCTNVNSQSMSSSNWTAIGSLAITNSGNATAIGAGATVSTTSDNSTSIGAGSYASAANSTAIGYNSSIISANSMQLGNGRDRNGVLNNFKVGIGTNAPVGNFHVADMVGTSTDGSTDIRFEDLPLYTQMTSVLVVRPYNSGSDPNRVGRRTIPLNLATGTCTTPGFLPMWSNTSLELTCSAVAQNGNTVGIGFNSTASIPTTGPQGPIVFATNGSAWVIGNFSTSDQRLKEKINKLNDASSKLKLINGYTYYFKPENDFGLITPKGRQYGLLAQEVEKVIPELVVTSDKGLKAINYDGLIPVLIEASKEQQLILENQNDQINKLNAKVDAQSTDIDNLKSKIQELENVISDCCSSVSMKSVLNTMPEEVGVLEQNTPNPFNEKTFINFFIPKSAVSAQVKIYSLNGIEMQSFNIKERGKGVLEVNANLLSAGTYVYHLVINGKEIDAKLMMLTK